MQPGRCSFGTLGASSGALWDVSGALGKSWGAPGSVLRLLGASCGTPWGTVGVLWRFLAAWRAYLGGSRSSAKPPGKHIEELVLPKQL